MTVINSSARLSHLESLPDDVFSQIVLLLDLPSLLRLQQLSRSLHERITHLALPLYLAAHPTPSLTLYPHPPSHPWPPALQIRHDHLTQRRLSPSHRHFHALQIGPAWPQKVIPTLLLTPDRLILGVGGKLLVHPLLPPSSSSSHRCSTKAVGRGREWVVARKGRSSDADIVGVAELSGGDLAVAQYDGTLQTLRLNSATGQVHSTAHFGHPRGTNIHTLAHSSGLLATTTSSGLVSLFRARSPWQPPLTFMSRHPARSWSSMLSTDHPASLPDALYLGQSGSIDIHPLSSSFSSKPSRSLTGPEPPARPSSPYAMLFPPLDQPSAHRPSTLLSAWYDSHLRLHDLRSPSSAPVLEASDPYTWADGSAFYSATFFAEHHIAGGGSRHGTVAIFDIRSPKKGFSVFSPGGRGSPVYALQGEGGRLWGVTEKRAFVLAFDGSGESAEGLVRPEARAVLGEEERRRAREKGRERVSGWKGRGGKWGWTVRYGDAAGTEGEGATAYEHQERGVRLFDSLKAA